MAAPCLQQGLEPIVHIAEAVQAGVRGPHPGKRLRDMAQGVFHGASAHGVTAGGDATSAVTVREELEDRDGITGEVAQVGTDPGGGAKRGPESPGASGGVLSMRSDAGAQRLRDSAPISAECIVVGRGRMVQEVRWG